LDHLVCAAQLASSIAANSEAFSKGFRKNGNNISAFGTFRYFDVAVCGDDDGRDLGVPSRLKTREPLAFARRIACVRDAASSHRAPAAGPIRAANTEEKS